MCSWLFRPRGGSSRPLASSYPDVKTCSDVQTHTEDDDDEGEGEPAYPPGPGLLYYTSISQAGAVGLLGPTLAENQPKTENNYKISYPPYWPLLAQAAPKARAGTNLPACPDRTCHLYYTALPRDPDPSPNRG